MAAAEILTCTLAADCEAGPACPASPLTLSFAIDRSDFAPSLYKNEPPRLVVTTVTQGDEVFRAEPILMRSGLRGFHADLPGGERLLTVSVEGAATYTDRGAQHQYRGTCTEAAP